MAENNTQNSRRTFNKVIIAGIIGADPEIHRSANNVVRATFSVSSHRRTSNGMKTDWLPVVAFNQLAEIIARYGKKGRLIHIDGALVASTWQDPNDANRQIKRLEIHAKELLFLDNKNPEAQENREAIEASTGENETGNQEAPEEVPSEVSTLDEILGKI